MIGWLVKKFAAPTTSVQPRSEAQRTVSPENCMLWRDVERALNAKPRTSK